MGWTFRDLYPDRGKSFLFTPERGDWLWGSFSLPFGEYWGSSRGVERRERDADCSPPLVSRLKKELSHTSGLPHMPLWCGEDNFTSTTLIAPVFM
jgi:hypothetical protein